MRFNVNDVPWTELLSRDDGVFSKLFILFLRAYVLKLRCDHGTNIVLEPW
jgi:hypothetical protein